MVQVDRSCKWPLEVASDVCPMVVVMVSQSTESLKLVKYVHFVNYNTNTQVKCIHGKIKSHVMKLSNLVLHQVTHPCRDDLCRISTDPSHVPRWKKKSQETVKCNAHGCSDVCFSKLQVLDIKQHFEEIELQFDGYIPFPTSPLQPSLLHCVQSNSASAEKLLNVWSFREA